MSSTAKTFWEDLVVAILSVNQYSLEKTFAAIEKMRGAGLCEPRNLANWPPSEIVARLKQADCDRGSFMTTLFAERLSDLGKYVDRVGMDRFEKVLTSGAATEIENLLLPIKGVGPKVLANFFLLQEISPENLKTREK